MSMNHIRSAPIGLTDSHTVAQCAPGTTFVDEITATGYVYVYNAGADAIAAADVVGVFSTWALGSVSVTAATMLDFDDAGDIVSHVAGVAIGAIAAASYGWLWAWGPSTTYTITTDGNVEKGDGLVLDDGTKVATTEIETQDHGNFGFAHAADVSSTLTGATLRGTAFWR